VKSLSSALLIEKNKLATSYPWVALVRFDFTSGTAYLAANTEEVTYGGQAYTPFHLEIDLPIDNTEPDIPECTIRAANQSRVFEILINESDGGVDSAVTITIVNTNNLADDYTNLTWNFYIMEVNCDNEYVTMTCSLYSPLDRKFPPDRYFGSTCRYKVFKGAECKYIGGQATCDRNHDTCSTYGNLANFGGFPGLFDLNIAFLFNKRA
jgi:phage-related protein